MPRFDQTLLLVNAPTSPAEASDLSDQLTLKFGNDGQRLVSMVTLGNPPVLLIAFEKTRPGS
jgi:hypothetical protein